MHSRDEIGKRAGALRIHGGRIDMASQLYPKSPQPWIDLSTGINPIAWPVPHIALARYQRLPLASEITQMKTAAAAAYGLPANAAIMPVSGSELAIRLLPHVIGVGRVGVLAPTYGSHAATWRDAGAEVHELVALPDPKAYDLDTLIVVNPNNPNGRTIARAELVAFGQAWTATGRRLIIDEAFADVRPEASVLSLPELPIGTVVLRSLGKFFGLAGLRVGFVIVTESDISPWRQLLGDWPVSGPACEIATLALRDAAWIAATRTRLAVDRRRLDGILTGAGLRLLGGADLFGLFEGPDGVELLDHFARAGILIRGFAAAPRWYRFGLPADEAAWRRLEATCGTLTA
ncbi:L-threonine O-3-phosphate decarboxylase [Bradyrhizobium canariense]|uniref:threonine-phosphate decarboxylase n=2 Tax=Bradyrhizobium canariense TaxID=255045 RepID=A0A1H1X7H6_9BRAD|nr:threonine-phosphate decarboxylase CobD [Bradyrhizobium canariense]SDT05257.1 L-threonine O-3-phosphate decarboxylase [Bradyrhizobium canariense]